MYSGFRSLVILLLLIIGCYGNSIAQNLITNPGFEDGISGWSNHAVNGGDANISIISAGSPEANNHMKAEVSALGTNDWDVQVSSTGFAVDESHKYRLTFKAKSDKSGAKVKVYIQSNEWMGKEFTLSNAWETHTYEFFPNEFTKQLKFNFVEITNYYLDDILLEDITPVNSNFNTPPSCVITAPHVNAYFKQGDAVTINAYAADIGGSGTPGQIDKVEFFIDNQKIGESTSSQDNTYFLVWNAESAGEFRITAKAIDTEGKSFTAAGILITVGQEDIKAIGLSTGKGKYLGNVVRNSGPEASFTTYWNAVTSGNGGKWQTVERNRDVMNWDIADEAYQLAIDNNLPYRYHTLAWGSQYPSWITTLAPAEFQAEMEEFISAAAVRYLYTDQIDVINEALPGHQEDTKYFIEGLGGAGESGYDWAVWLFKKAREYFPNAKLVLNDFAMVNSQSNIREELLLLRVLRDSALVDGFGAQGHTFNLDHLQAAELKANLDLMTNAGVPIYITEMDMQGVETTESSQLDSYEELFPVLWEHPHVAGITLWGYIYGDMWKPDAGLVYDNGGERSAMLWLKNYMGQQVDLGYPFGNKTITAIDLEPKYPNTSLILYPNPSSGEVFLRNKSILKTQIGIYDINGRLVDHFKLNSNAGTKRQLSSGFYLVKIENQKTLKLIVK